MLSECELIDAENISLLSQNMKLVGVSKKRTTMLIFYSIDHIHIQMTCLSSLNQTLSWIYDASIFVFWWEKSHNSKYLSAVTPLGQIRFNT
jgi:hypothetical protein